MWAGGRFPVLDALRRRNEEEVRTADYTNRQSRRLIPLAGPLEHIRPINSIGFVLQKQVALAVS